MKNLKGVIAMIIVISILTVVAIQFIKHPKKAHEIAFTNINIKNSSMEDSVKVFVTLQAPNRVMGLFGIVDTVPDNTSKGFFYAKKDSVYSSNVTTPLLGVVISFHGDNLPCQVAIPSGFPTGVNIFEFSVNTPFESFDISCVDGVNALLKSSVSDSTWTTGDSIYISRFDSASNKCSIGDNLNIRGVFPYRCSDCIDLGTAIPENCFNIKDSCNTIRTCQVNRQNKIGGSITIEYKSNCLVPCLTK